RTSFDATVVSTTAGPFSFSVSTISKTGGRLKISPTVTVGDRTIPLSDSDLDALAVADALFAVEQAAVPGTPVPTDALVPVIKEAIAKSGIPSANLGPISNVSVAINLSYNVQSIVSLPSMVSRAGSVFQF